MKIPQMEMKSPQIEMKVPQVEMTIVPQTVIHSADICFQNSQLQYLQSVIARLMRIPLRVQDGITCSGLN